VQVLRANLSRYSHDGSEFVFAQSRARRTPFAGEVGRPTRGGDDFGIMVGKGRNKNE